mmetsp:Transcript_30980/g.53653  ORF Transcript_30980/g.53653 Transcript_30980/m.53653 type:complete len:135 (-) Transcript_30980:65-469(-)
MEAHLQQVEEAAAQAKTRAREELNAAEQANLRAQASLETANKTIVMVEERLRMRRLENEQELQVLRARCSELEDRATAAARERECTMCMETEIDAAFIPCGHAAFCHGCSNRVKKCPICRAPVDQAIRIYGVSL